jgi:asparagine N-glycosylation enzyme membrane subunit Stt3
VLAPWHLGHVIAYRARRPTVIGNFGDDLGPETFAWARRYERASEAEIADEVAARGVRYVVVEGRARLSPQPLAPGSLADALIFRDGAELARHRLVFESQGARFTDAAAHALYKVFEFVAGAEVEGRSAPGSTIAVALDLRTPRGRAFTYEAHSVAGADGTYRVRLPYANRGGPPSVSAAPYYRLRCADQTGRLVLSEADVRDGRRVAGPPLCGGSGTAEPAGLTPGGAAADGEGRPPESE